MIYQIPEEKFAQLEEKIAKLMRRGKRAKQNPESQPMLHIVHEQDKPLYNPQSCGSIDTSRMTEVEPLCFDGKRPQPVGFRRYYYVELTGEAPTIPGYTLIGIIEHTNDSELGNIIRVVPGQVCPKEYRDATSTCDHCNVNRRRLETFVIYHAESNTFKQVGRNCLADFCRSPELAAELCGYAETLSQLVSMCEGSEDDEESYSRGDYTPIRINIESALALTARVIRHAGWLSRTKSQEYGGTPTANIVGNCLFNPKFFYKVDRYTHPDTIELQKATRDVQTQDVELAERALAWIRAKREERESLNDYLFNLLIVSSEETVIEKHMGILCSLISTFRREMEFQEVQKKQEERKPSNHIGVVKQRIKFVATVMGVRPFDSDFGTKYLIRMDVNGDDAIWWSSTDVCADLKEGEIIAVTGTVKKHGEFGKRKQTEFSRCKLEVFDETE